MTVTATASVTSTVTAMPGPKARKNPSRPTISEADPKATISPAVTMIGRKSRVVCSAARTRRSPEARLRLTPEKKKTE